MAGIGTAARNYWEEEEKKGIGTAATRVPGDGQGQGIGTAATRVPGQDISQPAQGIGTAATKQPGQVEYAASPTQQQPIQVMQGVTAGTQQKLNGLQTGYQPTTAAQAAQQALQAIQAQKPQGYNSQYAPQLQSILEQIQGQKDFKYEVNSDPFFRMLADRKTTDAKLASMDAMGQGAALTGGYGNSAAQGQAQQAYQEQLRGLYDEAISLEQRAFERDQARRADLYNQAGLLQGLDQAEYGRYRDTVGDWENERNYLTDLYNTEEDRGYNRYANDLDYYTRLAQIENADYRSEQERQEAIRQFNEQFNRGVFESDRAFEEQRRQADLDEAFRRDQLQENMRQFQESMEWDRLSSEQKYNFQTAMQILANGQMPSAELLEAAGLSAEDAQKLMAQPATGGSSGGRNTYYLDDNGNPYRQNKDGSFEAVDPSELKRGDQFIENAGAAIGISQTTKQVAGAVKNQEDLIKKLFGINK